MFGKYYSPSSAVHISDAHFDGGSFAVEGETGTGCGNSTLVIVVHVELVEVGVVVGVRPGNCLRSMAIDVVIKGYSGTSTNIPIRGLTNNFPGGPDKRDLMHKKGIKANQGTSECL